jgi:hypothetical protein
MKFFHNTLFNKVIDFLLTDDVGVDILKIIQPMFFSFYHNELDR